MKEIILMKYFGCRTDEAENREIDSWLADDPDGSHRKQFQTARVIYEGLLLHGDAEMDRIPVSRPAAHRLRVFIWAFAAAAAIALGVFLSYRFAEQKTMSEFSGRMLCATVPDGQTFKLFLEDGTSMFMNSGTEVEYPAVFSQKERKVKVIRGEVLFDVVRDDERPFVVETFASDVKVLGTRFNISSCPDHESCIVDLLRGRVKVDSRYDDHSVILEPDMRVSILHGMMTVEQLDHLAEVALWTQGLIDLQGLDFRTLMEKYEKAFGVRIVLPEGNLPQIDLQRGKVRISDGIEHALDVLKMASRFSYERDHETNTIYIM